MRTLNEYILRIKTLALAHNQIRRFKTGLTGDLFADKTAKYPACCLQYTAGTLSTAGHALTVNFRLWLVDLVHVAKDAKINEDDVLSDTLSILQDLVSEMANPNFNDWILSTDNQLQAVVEADGDLFAGWFFDFSIRIPYMQNVCEVPSDIFNYPSGGDSPVTENSKAVYDYEYISDGTEGSTLTPSTLLGKKVLLLIRDNNPIHKVSSNPDPAEFTWNNTSIVLGVPVSKAGERFLFLYRNY